MNDSVTVFSPLPPEENGVADYAYHLLAALAPHFECAAFTADPQAVAPAGVTVRDHLQAFRYLYPGARILHQIGNNPGHVFVLDALRRWGGVTTLHDQSLHYLYEVAGTSRSEMQRLMAATAPEMGSVYARHWHEAGVKTKANYALFDMLAEVLGASSAIVVHSAFAQHRLRALYGETTAERVVVIPHLALPFAPDPHAEAAARLAIPEDRPLLLTAGFATAAKRFDWLVAALDEICRRGGEFFWVHAGKERPEEFALSDLLDRHPAVRERSRITGYLSEDDLNSYIGACDVLINLRYPSVGESSGTLARAMSAGKCCIVSDTAAYADLPRDAVIHVPVQNAVPRLVAALEALLAAAPARAAVGMTAQHLAATEWSAESVAAQYAEVLRRHPAGVAAASQPKAAAVPRVALAAATPTRLAAELGEVSGAREIVLQAGTLREFAELSLARPRLVAAVLPPGFVLDGVRLEPDAGAPAESVSLRVRGIYR